MNVSIYSRKAIEMLLQEGQLKNSAVISFYDPEWREFGFPPINFDGKCEQTIRVAIHDITYDELNDFGLSIESYFPEANTVASFIYDARLKGLDIICQCEHGQSRSAGCAAAILQFFLKKGIDVFTDLRYCPNQLIYHKIFDALQKINQTEQRNNK